MSEKSIKFKRFFTAMLAVCLIIMLSCGSYLLYSSAYSYVDESIQDQYPLQYSLSDFTSRYGTSDNYIYISALRSEYNSQYHHDNQYYYCVYIPLDSSVTYTLTNNTFILDPNNTYTVYSGSYDYFTTQDNRIISNYSDFTINIGSTHDISIAEDLSSFSAYIFDFCSDDYLNFEFKCADLDLHYSDIRVSFAPRLSGEIDRCIDLGNGSTAMEQTLLMTVDNRSDFGIQYCMSIYKKNKVTQRNSVDINTSDNVFYDSDPVFTFYSQNWVYCTPYDNKNDFFSDDQSQLQMKATSWHHVGAGLTQQQVIKFSQMNLKQGEEYTVVVKAVRCDFQYSSEKFTSLSENDRIYSELYMLDRDAIETVYTSDFSFLQYDDVVYNPDDTSGGIVPYDGYTNGISQQKQYAMSRNAVLNDDGSIDYTHKDVYSDSNSWYHNQIVDGLPYDLPNYTPSGDGEYNDVLTKTIPVFGFFRTVFGYFPTDVFTIFNLSLWATFIILVIRRLH